MTSQWQYTDDTNTVVSRVLSSGGVESLLVSTLPEGVTPLPYQAPVLAQFDRDQARYTKRAAAKDSLLAFMAADNMSRVRSGMWTVQQLTSLISDPAVAAANSYMSTLSYELAAQAIQAAQTPLLTPAIKALWVKKLQDHFYNAA